MATESAPFAKPCLAAAATALLAAACVGTSVEGPWPAEEDAVQGAAGEPSESAPAMIVTSGTVTAAAAPVSVSLTDHLDDGSLRYTWSAPESAPGTVTFAPNGTNDARQATATFASPGSFPIRVAITDARGAAVSSLEASITVARSISAISVVPGSVRLERAAQTQFAVMARDQFGTAMATPPFAWSATGGTVSPDGRYTAGPWRGDYSVFAQAGSLEAAAAVAIER